MFEQTDDSLMVNSEIAINMNGNWGMIRYNTMNLFSFSVKYCNAIITRIIDNQQKGHAMNEGHEKVYEWQLRILILWASVMGKFILYIGL